MAFENFKFIGALPKGTKVLDIAYLRRSTDILMVIATDHGVYIFDGNKLEKIEP